MSYLVPVLFLAHPALSVVGHPALSCDMRLHCWLTVTWYAENKIKINPLNTPTCSINFLAFCFFVCACTFMLTGNSDHSDLRTWGSISHYFRINWLVFSMLHSFSPKWGNQCQLCTIKLWPHTHAFMVVQILQIQIENLLTSLEIILSWNVFYKLT